MSIQESMPGAINAAAKAHIEATCQRGADCAKHNIALLREHIANGNMTSESICRAGRTINHLENGGRISV